MRSAELSEVVAELAHECVGAWTALSEMGLTRGRSLHGERTRARSISYDRLKCAAGFRPARAHRRRILMPVDKMDQLIREAADAASYAAQAADAQRDVIERLDRIIELLKRLT